jgi:hypothetical protein
MDPIQTKFYQASFDIEKGKESLSLRGLISESGATKIFIPSGLPDFWKDQLGQLVTIKLDGIKLKGIFVQQFVEHGSFYELRFRDLDEPQRVYIRQRITLEGISPGWQRKFPRIPVGTKNDPDLPVPSLCMVRFVGQEIFVNVMNFTLGGIRIETLGDNLAEVRVGSQLHFDLVASNGAVMANLNGEVRNMAVHEVEKDGHKTLTRSFGLRFVDMDPANERKYRELIKEYCLVMKVKINEDKD